MAYDYGTPARTPYGIPGGGQAVLITISETDAATGDEWQVAGLPPVFEIVSYKAVLTSGTGTTIGPFELGSATGWSADTIDEIAVSTAAAAAFINDQTRLLCPVGAAGILYGKSLVNDATADHVITTQIVIRYGVA